jgi:hypothetical protein
LTWGPQGLSENEHVALADAGRRRAILGSGTPVPRAEQDGSPRSVARGEEAGLQRLCLVGASTQRCGQRRGVVDDDHVARAYEGGDVAHRLFLGAVASRIDDEQSLG